MSKEKTFQVYIYPKKSTYEYTCSVQTYVDPGSTVLSLAFWDVYKSCEKVISLCAISASRDIFPGGVQVISLKHEHQEWWCPASCLYGSLSLSI